MATLAEIAEAKEEQDQEMIALIQQGKTARQIGALMGTTASTVRNRAERVGMKCEQVVRRASAPTRVQKAAKPCNHKPGECRSMPCLSHRFGADLTCQCGVGWHQHQIDGLPCTEGKPAERLEVEHKETCFNGHDTSDPASVYIYPSGKKECRACRAERTLKSKEKTPEEKALPKPMRTHCDAGHPWLNLYHSPNGRKQCRECRRKRHREYAIRRKEEGR